MFDRMKSGLIQGFIFPATSCLTKTTAGLQHELKGIPNCIHQELCTVDVLSLPLYRIRSTGSATLQKSKVTILFCSTNDAYVHLIGFCLLYSMSDSSFFFSLNGVGYVYPDMAARIKR
jgi:hypothetical protein